MSKPHTDLLTEEGKSLFKLQIRSDHSKRADVWRKIDTVKRMLRTLAGDDDIGLTVTFDYRHIPYPHVIANVGTTQWAYPPYDEADKDMLEAMCSICDPANIAVDSKTATGMYHIDHLSGVRGNLIFYTNLTDEQQQTLWDLGKLENVTSSYAALVCGV